MSGAAVVAWLLRPWRTLTAPPCLPAPMGAALPVTQNNVMRRTASHLAAADHAQVAAQCAPVSAAIRCWCSVTSGERCSPTRDPIDASRQNPARIDRSGPWGYRSSSGRSRAA